MQPVRMQWKKANKISSSILSTHRDTSISAYEVSRALSAVEGVVLLVDATQGVEAQTLSVLATARELGRVIIPVVNKIDAPHARAWMTHAPEISMLLGCDEKDILATSRKNRRGCERTSRCDRRKIPPPVSSGDKLQALIYDFTYSDHRGVIIYCRLFGGKVRKGDRWKLAAANATFNAIESASSPPTKNRANCFPKARSAIS